MLILGFLLVLVFDSTVLRLVINWVAKCSEMSYCSMLGPEQVGLKTITEDIADVNRRHAHLSGSNNLVKQACVD